MTENIPRKTVILWEIRILLIFVVLWGIMGVFIEYSAVMTLIFACVYAVFAIYTPFYLKSFEVCSSEKSIEIKSGIIIKVNHIMPTPRLIYGETLTTPVAAMLGVSAVCLKAARGWVIVPEIEKTKAQSLLKLITGEKTK